MSPSAFGWHVHGQKHKRARRVELLRCAGWYRGGLY